ncbi:MAG TPA: cytochrome c biogenesis protein CcsA [Steroidobacteraceae bacterium]|nr:cytochrome c biogenesis protein CcsA [Steroidobacteraceae bacterium]
MLAVIVLACYFGASIWLLTSASEAQLRIAPGQRIAGIALGTVAFVLHGWLLWIALSSAAMAFSVADTASLVGWTIALIALITSLQRPRFAGACALLLVLAGIVAVSTHREAPGFVVEHRDWRLVAHVVLSTLAYALLSVAAVLAVAVTAVHRRLRSRKPVGGLRVLPPLESLEGTMFQALVAGWILLSLALFSGFVFVQDLMAQHLAHKTILSCLAWAVFAALIFGRWRYGWRGPRLTYWVLSGVALLLLAYFGAKIVLESVLGRHWG